MLQRTEHELQYQRRRETRYVVDFNKIFGFEIKGHTMASLMANYKAELQEALTDEDFR